MRALIKTGLALAAIALVAPAAAQQAPAEPKPMPTNPYAPYEWLIGDWYSQAGPERIHQQLRYGPNRSYIHYSTFTNAPGKPEKLHFEGIMVWNAKSKALDYVFAVEPGTGVQEKGTVQAQNDGTIVREVEFTGADGRIAHFRQRFWRTGAEFFTSLQRQTATGWDFSFPGSDRITMTRRAG